MAVNVRRRRFRHNGVDRSAWTMLMASASERVGTASLLTTPVSNDIYLNHRGHHSLRCLSYRACCGSGGKSEVSNRLDQCSRVWWRTAYLRQFRDGIIRVFCLRDDKVTQNGAKICRSSDWWTSWCVDRNIALGQWSCQRQ